MRLASLLATIVLTTALLAGCGGGSEEDGSRASKPEVPQAKGAAEPAGATAHECRGRAGTRARLRATGVPCSVAVGLTRAWERKAACVPAAGSSRAACEIGGGYRCLSLVTDRGVTVSCARPGRSIAFTVRRG